VSLGGAGPIQAADTWQEEMRFSPPPGQIELGERGRVMIYDGLTDTRIAGAIDTQFVRIESMMSVRTVVTDSQGAVLRDTATGKVLVEDDGYRAGSWPQPAFLCTVPVVR
jgi:hypothetical protein